VNAPETLEGIGVWDVVTKITGQIRVANGIIVGLDFAAVLALGRDLGTDTFVLAECLPAIEAVIVAKLNEQIANR
jgi:hypothetical protein